MIFYMLLKAKNSFKKDEIYFPSNRKDKYFWAVY